MVLLDTAGKGVQLIRPVNLNGAMNVSSFITLGFPLKGKLKGSNFNFNNSVQYSKGVSELYKQKNTTNSLVISQTIGINLDIKLQGDYYDGQVGTKLTIPSLPSPFALTPAGDFPVSGGNLFRN